jgi:hypothetical protein
VPPPGRPVQLGAHGHTITLIAISDDGSAVATADFNRTLRLWPALDGTREPIVVTGPGAQSIAIARDADAGFAVAVLDSGGVVHVERVRGTGEQLREVEIESPLPYEQVEPMRGGFAALRSDDTVELIAPDGKRTPIAPPPARITRLVARGDQLLALTAGKGQLLANGAWVATPALPIDPAHAVLAPDGKHVAGTRLAPAHGVVEIALDNGVIHQVADSPDEVPLGFTAAGTLATTTGAGVLWRTGGELGRTPLGLSQIAFTDTNTVVADGRVATGFGVQLALPVPAPQKTKYLGYQVVDPAPLRPTALGLVVRTDRPVLLDEQLGGRVLFDKHHEAEWMDFVAIDDRHGVALVREFADDMERRWLVLLDLTTGAHLQKLAADARLDNLVYEPSTQLLATLSIDGGQLFHYESGKFVKAADLPGAPDRIFLLDPALAHGDVAVVIQDNRSASYAANDFKRGHDRKVVDGQLLAIDRAGQVYTRKGDDLIVGGVKLPGLGKFNVRPSPDLKRIAAFTSDHVALIDRDGTVRWSVAAWATRDVGWTPDNELVASMGGLVRLDLATGQPIARRCGWIFGLSDAVREGAPLGISACDQL